MDPTNPSPAAPGETPSAAARALARSRQHQSMLKIALGASILLNIVTPLVLTYLHTHRREMVIFDVNSGTVLLSPVVSPTSSGEVINTESQWAAQCLLDRSPAGLVNEQLIGFVFDKPTREKAEKEFADHKPEYEAKALRKRVELREISGQPIGPKDPLAPGAIKVRVVGQLITTGVVDGEALQEVQPVAVEFLFARNPDVTRYPKYPLMVYGYQYVEVGQVAQR